MKSLRVLFRSALVLAASCCLCCIVSGQTDPASSNAQKGLDLMKTLAGNWQGSITTDSPAWATDKPLPLTVRVASHGNAVVHELNTGGPEVTVFYVDKDGLELTHYCDFGNRPLMTAQPSADGKTLNFTLTSFAGSDAVGHVTQGTFTVTDTDHHTEDWVFQPAGGKTVHAHIAFTRVQ